MNFHFKFIYCKLCHDDLKNYPSENYFILLLTSCFTLKYNDRIDCLYNVSENRRNFIDFHGIFNINLHFKNFVIKFFFPQFSDKRKIFLYNFPACLSRFLFISIHFVKSFGLIVMEASQRFCIYMLQNAIGSMNASHLFMLTIHETMRIEQLAKAFWNLWQQTCLMNIAQVSINFNEFYGDFLLAIACHAFSIYFISLIVCLCACSFASQKANLM